MSVKKLLDKKTAAKKRPDSYRMKPSGKDGRYIESLSGKVKTVEDALRKGGVDETIWEVKDFLLNSWEVGAKGPDGVIVTSPLWQVKLWVTRKKGWSTGELRKLILADAKSVAPVYKAPAYLKKRKSEPLLAELSIFDAHFGKLAWKEESGANYDLKICENRYMKAARDLLGRAFRREPERLLYVVGQDFFHTDQGRVGATTNGTPQDCDGRWQKAFRVGTRCAITIAEEARTFAPVDILVVPGNHDAEKSFCLGDVLAGRFHNCPNVRVINNPDTFSYYRYGKCLLGFVHGDTIRGEAGRAQLGATMATDRPKDWAETICREWHLGHIHHERETVWKYRTAEAIRDVIVRTLPSLSSSDAWHRRNNYKSVLAAEMHLYHRTTGRHAYEVHSAYE